MYTIEVADYGSRLKSWGFHTGDISTSWFDLYNQKLAYVKSVGKPFVQLVDLRGFKPGAPDAQEGIRSAMVKFKEAGGVRSAVILDNIVSLMQIRRLAREFGIYDWERSLDPETHPDFELAALAWIKYDEDPDVRLAG